MAAEVAVIDETDWNVLRLAGSLDEKRKHIFLRVLAGTANMKLAVEAAGFKTTAAVNRARQGDPAFNEAFQEALEAGADMIEAEAVRRAVQGVRKAVYFKGEIIDYENVYSDSLLQTLLKAAKPDKYADRSKSTVDVTGKVGIAVIPMAVKSLADWEKQSLIAHLNQEALDAPEKPEPIDVEFTEVSTDVERG